MQLRDGDINLTTLAGRIFKNDNLIEMGKMIKPVGKKIEKKKQNLTSRFLREPQPLEMDRRGAEETQQEQY